MGFSLSGLFGGGGGGGTPTLDRNAFDLSQAVQKYGGYSEEQIAQAKQRQAMNAAANQQLIQQLQQQAGGQGPSLAQAQLKSMQDRGLAQTMAVAASQRGANPALAARQLMLQQAAAGRANASQGAILGLQERQQAQQLLGGQLTSGQGQADALASNSIGQGFGQEQASKQLMGQFEAKRFDADVARTNAIHAQQNNILGSVLGAAGTLAGGYFGAMAGPGGAAIGSQLGGKIGGSVGGAGKFDGGMIEGEEVMPGDHPANDTVNTQLSPGEIVVPKSIIAAGPDAAKSFIEAIMKAHVPPKHVGFAAVAATKPKKMYEGGKVRAPTGKQDEPIDRSEKPVPNQWKGFDQAIANLKSAFDAPKKGR